MRDSRQEVQPRGSKPVKPPAFQFYPDDFVGGVADMTQAEVGAYILLLCHQWSRGEIPSDPERASLIAKGEVSDHVMAKFPNGKNERMELVRAERAAWVERQRDNGRKGMAKRWHNQAYNEPITTLQPEHNSPSPSPTPIVEMSEGAETEPPAGFPKSESEAIAQAGFVGATPEHAAKCYNLAVSRGYRDAKGNLIRNFRSYLKVTQSYEHDRIRSSNQSPDRNKGYNATQTADALARKVL